MKRKLNCEDDEETNSHVCEAKYDVNSFEPLHFLRCHSKKNDPADVHTQVWQCAFEPNVDSPGCNTNVLATCGGNSVCFIDSITGNVIGKFYSEKPHILLYALAWTTLHPGGGRRCNILAVGGTSCYLQLIHLGKKCSLLTSSQSYLVSDINSRKKAKEMISYITFHPSRRSILFCSSNSGAISAWDISDCHPWSSEITLKPVLKISAHSEVFSLSITKSMDILLAGCNSGLLGWCLEDVNWDEKNFNQSRFMSCIEFELPALEDNASINDVGDLEESLVDSVVCIPGGSLVALKCALRGVIYLWDLRSTIEKQDVKSKAKLGFKGLKLKINPVKYLKWSDTDDYFMSMGCTPDGRLLACGDDEGAIWLYNLKMEEEEEQKAKKAKMDAADELIQQPCQRLLWPENLEDEEVRTARKVKRLEGHGGVIDQVALGIGHNGSLHLAAVTSTNLVCLWRAVGDENFQDPQFLID